VRVERARRLQKGWGVKWEVSWADSFVIPIVSPSVIVCEPEFNYSWLEHWVK